MDTEKFKELNKMCLECTGIELKNNDDIYIQLKYIKGILIDEAEYNFNQLVSEYGKLTSESI